MNGQLYAVGGFDGTTYLKTVEVYERETSSWRHAGNMNYRRLGGGVGVVKLANEDMQSMASSQSAAVSIDVVAEPLTSATGNGYGRIERSKNAK